jgi:tetratricopeptide (TPR) repeat protein
MLTHRSGSMNMEMAASLLAAAFLLSGCAGVGIVSASDPGTKLNDAEVLFQRKNRPVPAEKLIQEALVIYQERADPHGLGNAHREYGDLLKSPAVANWEPSYRKSGGFLDKSITFDNRLTKASEHYSIALEYYRRAEQRELAASRYDALTNVYYNMAWSNLALGAQDEACADFEKSLQAYNENMRRNPTAHPNGAHNLGALSDTLALAKQQAGCR